jgi:hypothetical protein
MEDARMSAAEASRPWGTTRTRVVATIAVALALALAAAAASRTPVSVHAGNSWSRMMVTIEPIEPDGNSWSLF